MFRVRETNPFGAVEGADGEHLTVDGRSVYRWEIDEALKLAGTRSSSPAPYT